MIKIISTFALLNVVCSAVYSNKLCSVLKMVEKQECVNNDSKFCTIIKDLND